MAGLEGAPHQDRACRQTRASVLARSRLTVPPMRKSQPIRPHCSIREVQAYDDAAGGAARRPFCGGGGAGACSILANADRRFGRGGTARPRRPKALSQSGCRSGDGAAVAGGDTLAVGFRDTLSRRAGRTTTTSARGAGRSSSSRVVWQIVWTAPHGRGRRPTLSTLATSTVPLLLQPRGRRPGPERVSLGPRAAVRHVRKNSLSWRR